MRNHYLIEVTQKQTFYFTIEAESASEAIELAVKQDSNLSEAMPPEIEQVNAKCIGGD
jgi:hypothetical protein